MFIAINNRRRERRGIVLLVVIAMLALFAALGLSFVYYAQSEADAANMSTQAQTQNSIDIDPEFLLSYALNQLIFDSEDQVQYGTRHNVSSSLRGHSLGRNIFGYNPDTLNITPFNGVGRPNSINDPDVGLPVDQLVNYRFFRGDGNLFGSGVDFIRDPGRYGTANRNAKTDPKVPDPTMVPPFNPYFGENVPYTYADLQNFYLGQMSANGEILKRSFWAGGWTVGGETLTLNKSFRMWSPAGEPDPKKRPFPWMKYATLRPLPYYNYGFPPPEDGGGDVRNVEFGPGIPNGPGYYRNDSIWIDLGFPVRIGPDGRRYKPLFAFFICDLDGKVNVNVAGNVRLNDGSMYGHGSNKGFTPTEINIGHVLDYRPLDKNGKPDTTKQPEWPNLFLYQDSQGKWGRYGKDQRPSNAGASWPVGAPSASPYYGFTDVDGAKNDPANSDATRLYSEKIKYPGNSKYPNFVAFPELPSNTYQNGSKWELLELPWLYRCKDHMMLSGDGSDDRRYALSNLEALLRYQGTGSPAMTSELMLYERLYNNLSNADGRDNSHKRWRTITTDSVDFARPGIAPWLTAAAAIKYKIAAGEQYPKGGLVALPQVSPNANEFGLDLRGWAAILTSTRLNLQRTLAAYPTPDANGHIDATAAATAISERQQFAQDIFERLRFVTTGARPTDAIDKMALPPEEYDALRWLAQLAANMVDYIDADDMMTPFLWDVAGISFVVGTELPRLVLNEVYAEVNNDPTDPGVKMDKKANKDFQINFWVELLNPMLKEPAGTSNAVRLYVADGGKGKPPFANYKVSIIQGFDATLRNLSNVLGDPDPVNLGNVKIDVDDYNPDPKGMVMLDPDLHYWVQAVDQNFTGTNGKNEGFYVLGPQYQFPTDGMAKVFPEATLRVQDQKGKKPHSSMSYDWDKANDPKDAPQHTLLLRRLACPGLEPQPDPTNTKIPFNPYVTVDYIEGVPTNDAAEFDTTGARMNFKKVDKRDAYGRQQPFAAAADFANAMKKAYSNKSQIQAQVADADTAKNGYQPYTDQPQHTMFQHNVPPDWTDNKNPPKFDWLAHLDRMVSSPIELLHVSAFQPHELTQQFIIVDPNTNQISNHRHLADWTSSDTRLYRFLEYVDAGWRMANMPQTGRVPGKININTIWDPELLLALSDPHTGSSFTSPYISKVFQRLLNSRSPSKLPAPGDVPFHSLAAPHTSASDGVDSTLLRKDPSNMSSLRLFEVDPSDSDNTGAADHPTVRTELLSKIFNNITTRSNVFAVWLTVGFFEVHGEEDTNGNGVHDKSEDNLVVNGVRDTDLLGKEVGRDDNRHVRHRMFAIVDRTGLMMPKNLAQVSSAVIGDPKNQPETVDIFLGNNPIKMPTPYRAEYSFYPQKGMTLDIVDPNGANRETITIISVNTNPPRISAVFQKPHPAGSFLTVPQDLAIDAGTIGGMPLIHGNPGPQLRFDHRHHMGLVPYYSIIQ